MKTEQILNKYRKILSPILDCKEKELRFFVDNTYISNDLLSSNFNLQSLIQNRLVREITKIIYFEPEKDAHGDETGEQIKHTRWNNWSEGLYAVVCKNRVVAKFELYKMQHCCAIIVSCKAFVEKSFRNKRIGTILNSFRQDIGKLLGYSLMLCTDIEKNTHQRQLLKTNGWKDIYSVINKRTSNKVYLSVINL